MTALEAYQAVVLAKSGTLDPERLGRVESYAMWQNARGPTWDSAQLARDNQGKERRPFVNWEARWDTVLAAMPGSRQDIVDRTGLSDEMVKTALRKLKKDGRTKAVQVGYRAFLWERIEGEVSACTVSGRVVEVWHGNTNGRD